MPRFVAWAATAEMCRVRLRTGLQPTTGAIEIITQVWRNRQRPRSGSYGRQLPANKKNRCRDHVNGEKLDAFDPVGFAVAADLKQDVNRSDYGETSGRETRSPSAYQTNRRRIASSGGDKRRSAARSNRDPNAQIHFVFQRHENGGRVLAALPIIATTIMPTETSVIRTSPRTLSIVPTKNSESKATNQWQRAGP